MKLLEVEKSDCTVSGKHQSGMQGIFSGRIRRTAWDRRGFRCRESTAMLSLMGILPEQVQITSEKFEAARDKSNDLSGCFGIFEIRWSVWESSSQRPFWHIRGVPEKKPESGRKHFWMKWGIQKSRAENEAVSV